MDVNDALIDKLALLSRLHFDAAEKEEIKSDLQKMLAMVEKLQEVDTAGVSPLLHMSNGVNIVRGDTAAAPMKNETALENAAFTEKEFFAVPKVIKTNL